MTGEKQDHFTVSIQKKKISLVTCIFAPRAPICAVKKLQHYDYPLWVQYGTFAITSKCMIKMVWIFYSTYFKLFPRGGRNFRSIEALESISKFPNLAVVYKERQNDLFFAGHCIFLRFRKRACCSTYYL